MTDIFRLVKKDMMIGFTKINRTNVFILMYPICMSIGMIGTNNPMISAQIVISGVAYAVYGFLLGIVSKEEKFDLTIMFKSLPIKKEAIIVGKYVFTLVLIVAASAVCSIIPFIKGFVNNNKMLGFMIFFNSIIYCAILFSLFFPVYYKMGYLKMQTINMIIFYGLIFIPIGINIFRDMSIARPLYNIMCNAMSIATQNYFSTIAGTLIIYIISIISSCIIENNK